MDNEGGRELLLAEQALHKYNLSNSRSVIDTRSAIFFAFFAVFYCQLAQCAFFHSAPQKLMLKSLLLSASKEIRNLSTQILHSYMVSKPPSFFHFTLAIQVHSKNNIRFNCQTSNHNYHNKGNISQEIICTLFRFDETFFAFFFNITNWGFST